MRLGLVTSYLILTDKPFGLISRNIAGVFYVSMEYKEISPSNGFRAIVS